jgi:hypothetical protein
MQRHTLLDNDGNGGGLGDDDNTMPGSAGK